MTELREVLERIVTGAEYGSGTDAIEWLCCLRLSFAIR
jgi:hypothetical protein